MRSKNTLPKATFESAWAIVEQNARNSEKYDRYIEEMREDRRKRDEEARKRDEETRKRDEEIRKREKEREDKEWQEFRESMKAMQQELGGISNSNGEVAESYFINSFTNCMQFAGQDYDSLTPNLRKKDKRLNLQGEYDLVLYNCTSVAIIEIKYKAKKKDVEQLLKKVPVFKQLFPEYANYNIYLGLAGMHVNIAVEKKAIKQGMAVIKQVGDNMVIYEEHLKAF